MALAGSVLVGAPALRPCPLAAQQPARDVRVFLSEFSQTRGNSPVPGLAVVSTGMVHLGFATLPRVAVVRTPRAPACGTLVGSAAGVATSDTTAPVAGLGDFSVSGAIDPSAVGFRISYQVLRCGASGFSAVSTDSRDIALRNSAPEFAALTQAIAGSVEAALPRTRVGIRPLQVAGFPDSVAVSETALQALSDELWRTGSFVAVAPDSAELLVEGRVSRTPRGLVGALTVLRKGGATPADTIAVTAPRDSLGVFYTRLAERATARLGRLQFLSATRLTPAQADSLVARARATACAPGACSTAELDARIAELTLATELGRTDPSTYLLLGRALHARGDAAAAVAAFVRALSRDRGELTRSERAEGFAQLGDAYRQQGDLQRAVAAYQASLGVRDSAEIALKLAQSQRTQGRKTDALRGLAARLRATRDGGALEQEFISTLASMTPAELADSIRAVQAVCGAPPPLRARCAVVVAERAAAASETPLAPPQLRTVYTAVLALAPEAPEVRALAWGQLALVALGPYYFGPTEDGRIRLSSMGGQRDSARVYLARADSAAGPGAAPSLREWLLRLRTQLLFGDGDFVRAHEVSSMAVRVNPSPDAVLLNAKAAYLLATADPPQSGLDAAARRELLEGAVRELATLAERGVSSAYAYYRAAMHELGRDQASQQLLQKIVERSPGDASARDELLYVCMEYVGDFRCGMRVTLLADSMRLLRTPQDSVAAAEVAILAGNTGGAERWLSPLSGDRLTGDACIDAVGSFYAFWLSGLKRDQPGMIRNFAKWRRVLARQPRAAGGCWLFGGAQTLLARQPGTPYRETLRGMIAAMKDPDAPVVPPFDLPPQG